MVTDVKVQINYNFFSLNPCELRIIPVSRNNPRTRGLLDLILSVIIRDVIYKFICLLCS